jgi:hypothetical protein
MEQEMEGVAQHLLGNGNWNRDSTRPKKVGTNFLGSWDGGEAHPLWRATNSAAAMNIPLTLAG